MGLGGGGRRSRVSRLSLLRSDPRSGRRGPPGRAMQFIDPTSISKPANGGFLESKNNAGPRNAETLFPKADRFPTRAAASEWGPAIRKTIRQFRIKGADNAHNKSSRPCRSLRLSFTMGLGGNEPWASNLNAGPLWQANVSVMRYVHLSREHLGDSTLLYGSAPVRQAIRLDESVVSIILRRRK